MKPRPLQRKHPDQRVGHSADMPPVNLPRAVQVSADADGRPLRIQQGRVGAKVAAVQNEFRISDRWWSESPVDRHYWVCELVNGEVASVFHDLVGGGWYEQRYTPPRDPEPQRWRAPEEWAGDGDG